MSGDTGKSFVGIEPGKCAESVIQALDSDIKGAITMEGLVSQWRHLGGGAVELEKFASSMDKIVEIRSNSSR
jgi:hypothetical protein